MSSSVAYSRATPSLHRTLVISRIEQRCPTQIRTLWWWGRQGSWSSTNEDALEERMQRHQKILRHRYSRALRRRAMWDRDDSPPSWSWRSPGRLLDGRWACKPLSTSEYMQARLKEDETGIPDDDMPWTNNEENFKLFKARLDEMLEKDPHGVLFGPYIRAEKSKWKSWSDYADSMVDYNPWFNPFHAPAGSSKMIKIENLDEVKPKFKQDSTTAGSKSSLTGEQQVSAEGEYVYDPVSGRKVWKPISPSKEDTQPRKPFLATLFSEHHAEERSSKTPAKKVTLQAKSPVSTKFETSRSREYQQLRAATIGTSIDTTVVFSTQPESSKNVEEAVRKPSRTYSEPDEDAPLFSGTTYEGRADVHEPNPKLNARNDGSWLQREGFQHGKTPVSAVQSTENSSEHTSGANKKKLEPSLDRLQNGEQPVSKSYVTKLQPAMDRMSNRNVSEVSSKRSAPLNILVKKQPAALTLVDNDTHQDKREDLDLLRASDIRAATKSARTTKQEVDLAKADARNKLEEDFDERQKAAEASSDIDAARTAVRSAKSSSSIDSVRRHMLRYPDGIVAKTMRSMGMFNDNFKKYERPGKSHIDLTEKIELKQEALDKLPSIFNGGGKPVSAMKTEASPEVEQIEKAKSELSKAIVTAKQKAIEQWQNESLQVQKLANSIRETFESFTSAVTSQIEGLKEEDKQPKSQQAISTKTQTAAHPLQTATVKAGVVTYPDIEYHTHVFEPKLIAIREGIKAASKNSASMHTELDNLKTAIIQSNQITKLPATEEDITAEPPRIIETNVQHPESSNQVVKSGSAANTQVEQPKVDVESVVVEKTSKPVTNKAPSKPTSAYVILTYNKNTGDVDLTQLSSLMGTFTIPEKINPIAVMGNLNYPAAFVSHFVGLETAGYQLSSGGGDLLIFQKKDHVSEVEAIKTEALDHIKLIRSDITELRNKIAEEEAQSQPSPSISPVSNKSKQAATVLDEMPVDIPTPGPAAPTAPPIFWQDKKKNKKGTKIRRQEPVFSGTIRSKNDTPSQEVPPNHKPQRGSIYRFFKTLTAVINSVVALGVVTYVIGVVAEARSAHAQQERGTIEGSDVGPRKKVVMPASRPGIYSTESSRD